MEQRIAIFKFGSTTFRVLLYECVNGNWLKIHQMKQTVLMGLSYHQNGLLDQTVVFHAITKMVEEIEKFKPYNSLGIATGFFRFATNAKNILMEIQKQFRIDVHLASEEEEASITRMAVCRHVQQEDILIVDIGGGTTEFSHPFLPSSCAQVGTTSIIEDPSYLSAPTPVEIISKVRHDCQVRLQNAQLPMWELGSVFGVGSCFWDVSNLFRQDGKPKNSIITLELMKNTIECLAPLTMEQRSKLHGFEPKRVELLLASAILVEQVMLALRVDLIQLADVSTSDGIFYWFFNNRKI